MLTAKLAKDGMRPMHPGEMLREEFLVPLKLSANKLAQANGVPANRVSGIVAEKRALTADTALRLAKFFRMSPEFWMSLQQNYELRLAEVASAKSKSLRGIRPIAQAAIDAAAAAE
jgi:antitoxin HigA-1